MSNGDNTQNQGQSWLDKAKRFTPNPRDFDISRLPIPFAPGLPGLVNVGDIQAGLRSAREGTGFIPGVYESASTRLSGDVGSPFRWLVGGEQQAAAPTGGAQVMPGGMTQEEAYRLLNPMRTGGGGAGAQIRAEQEAARRYWNNVSRYGQTRGQALGQAYGQLSGRTARTGADIGQRGLETAASIEQIYQNLANQAQALAGGRGGMVTPETAASGLVPMSAEAALAAQQIPAEGASLANYLQQNVGIQASMLDALARAQAEQGAATIADYLGQIATGRIADERRMADRAAQLRAAAAAASSARQDQWNQGLAQARALDLTRGNEVRSLTAYYNSEAGKDFKKRIDKFAKDNNYTAASVLADPSTAKIVGGITPITGA